MRNLLAQAEASFEAADEAFAEGKVGQWATLVEEGQREGRRRPSRILNERNGDEATDGPTADPERGADARRVTDPGFGWPCAVE